MKGDITFQTAQLAEQKGYPFEYVGSTLVNIPTQAAVQTWLRDIHKINVNVHHITHNQNYGYRITGSYHEGDQGVLKPYSFKNYEEYELALEQGLFDALELIK